jgi:hypothetical protein
MSCMASSSRSSSCVSLGVDPSFSRLSRRMYASLSAVRISPIAVIGWSVMAFVATGRRAEFGKCFRESAGRAYAPVYFGHWYVGESLSWSALSKGSRSKGQLEMRYELSNFICLTNFPISSSCACKLMFSTISTFSLCCVSRRMRHRLVTRICSDAGRPQHPHS